MLMKIQAYVLFWQFYSYNSCIYVFDPFWGVFFLIWCEVWIQIHSFAYDYPVVPFVERLFFSHWIVFGTLVDNQLAINISGYFWTFNSVPLIYMSALITVPDSFEYWSFVISFEIGECISFNFVSKIVLGSMTPLISIWI